MTLAMMAYSAFLLWFITILTLAYQVAKAISEFRISRIVQSVFTIDSFHFDLEDPKEEEYVN